MNTFYFNTRVMATTINDIKNDLSLSPSHGNHKYMVEKFEIAIENNSLEVNYS